MELRSLSATMQSFLPYSRIQASGVHQGAEHDWKCVAKAKNRRS